MQRAVLGWVLLSRWLYEQHRSDMSGRAVQLVRRQQLSAVFIGTVWRDGRFTDVELHRCLYRGVLLSRRILQLNGNDL